MNRFTDIDNPYAEVFISQACYCSNEEVEQLVKAAEAFEKSKEQFADKWAHAIKTVPGGGWQFKLMLETFMDWTDSKDSDAWEEEAIYMRKLFSEAWDEILRNSGIHIDCD